MFRRIRFEELEDVPDVSKPVEAISKTCMAGELAEAMNESRGSSSPSGYTDRRIDD